MTQIKSSLIKTGVMAATLGIAVAAPALAIAGPIPGNLSPVVMSTINVNRATPVSLDINNNINFNIGHLQNDAGVKPASLLSYASQ